MFSKIFIILLVFLALLIISGMMFLTKRPYADKPPRYKGTGSPKIFLILITAFIIIGFMIVVYELWFSL